MHDAEPAARYLYVLCGPAWWPRGGFDSRPDLLLYSPNVQSNFRPPLYALPPELKKPRGRYAWSGGLFLRYVRPPPPNLTRVRVGTEGGGFLCVI